MRHQKVFRSMYKSYRMFYLVAMGVRKGTADIVFVLEHLVC